MTPKEIEQIISQISELRFQFLFRIQFHLNVNSPELFFSLKKSEIDLSKLNSKGAQKMIQGYWDLFETETDSAFLLENESIQSAVLKLENILDKIQLNNEKVNWFEIRKSVKID